MPCEQDIGVFTLISPDSAYQKRVANGGEKFKFGFKSNAICIFQCLQCNIASRTAGDHSTTSGT